VHEVRTLGAGVLKRGLQKLLVAQLVKKSPRLSLNRKVRYSVHKSTLLALILSHHILLLILTSYLFMIYSGTTLPSTHRDSGYGMDDRSSIPGNNSEGIFLSSPPRPDRLWGPTQPHIQWVPRSLSPGVKRSGRKADYWPPGSVEIKNAWTYNSTPPYVFVVWCLIKYRNNFISPCTRKPPTWSLPFRVSD